MDWWDDTKIKPGSQWLEEIKKALDSAKVAVLLVSADFFASDFIAEYELPPLLKAAKTEGATILAVIISPSRFTKDKSLSEFQAVNDPSRPLIDMKRGEREKLWVSLTELIEAALVAPATLPVERIDKPDVQHPSQSASIAGPTLIQPDLAPAVGIFINRQEYLKTIQEFLADRAGRLVIVQGLPGIGKTTLAARLAEAIRERFKAVLWITCRDDQASPDVLFAKLHAFFEEHGEQGLRGIWNDPRPDQLEMKINRLIRALDANSYLLIFDEFQNWLADFQLKNSDVTQVLAGILRTAHQSKIVLISDQRPRLDPMVFHLPVGSMRESTLLGLSKPNAIQLLKETGFTIEDEKLLNRIIEHCDGNPYMLQLFSYLVSGLHRDPEELLASAETGTKFNRLLQAVTRDLSQDSHSALEMLSILRLPLSQRQLQAPDLRIDKVIGPLLDRFLVIEDTQSRKFGVSTVVRNFIKEILSEPRRRQLHEQAVAFYVNQRAGQLPQNYEELQLALEEGSHRFDSGDREGGARAIISVTSLLIDWGYIELAEENIFQALNNTNDQTVTAQCRWLQGSIADLRSDYSGALERFKDALQLYETANDCSGMARTLFRIGRIHNALDAFDTANEHFQRCIHTCEEHTVTDGWAASLLGIAWTLQERSSDVEKVLKLYQQSIERAEQSNDLETLSSAHRQMGFLLWTKRRQKDEAQEHYKQALQVSEKGSLVKEIGTIHMDMGYLYDEWGEYDKAQQSCQQAIEIFKALGNNYGLSSTYLNLGKVFESKQDLEAAVVWYNQSRSISASINNPGGQAYACFRLGKVLRQQGKLAEAEAVLLKAARLSKEHDLVETLSAAEQQLFQIKQLSE